MDPAVLREDMVDGLEHTLSADIDDDVNVAMRTVPRHEFVDEGAYDNRPNEHEGTRILAPGTVARMLTALAANPDDDVLIVGAGVGYTAAVLAEIVGDRRVHAIDITRPIVYDARQNLRVAGYEAVLVDCRDGAEGLPTYAPFDRILLEAAAVRPPQALVDQLTPDGRLVMPLGTGEQTLAAVEPKEYRSDGTTDDSHTRVTSDAPGTVVEQFGPVAFAPMLVEGEQAGTPTRNRTRREDDEFAEQGYFAKTGWEHDWVDWEEHL